MNFRVEYINKLKIFITVIAIIAISISAYLFKDVFKNLEEKTIDLRSLITTNYGLFSTRYNHSSNNIVILSINDLTQYEAANSPELYLTRWPWSRVVWAKIINFIERQNPKVLVVDLNFSNYEDLSRNYTSPDMMLADTLGYYKNIVLSTALKTPQHIKSSYDSSKIIEEFDNPYNPTSYDLNIYIDDKNIEKNITYYSHAPIPNIFTRSAMMGVTNLVTSENKNENIRYSQPVYKLIKGNREYYIPSIALATLLKYKNSQQVTDEISIINNTLKIGDNKIRLNEDGKALINWHPLEEKYTDIPITAILLSMVRNTDYFEFKNEKQPLSFFKDKIVIITQTQQNTETHNTPLAKSVTDAQIKATIIDNYINDSDTTNKTRKNFLKNITPYKGTILTVAFCLTIIFSMLIATNMTLAFFNGILTILTYIFLSIFLFAHPKFRIVIEMAIPLYFIISTFAISYVLKLHHEIKKKNKIEKIFGNLVSEKVLKQLTNKPHRLNLKSTLKQVTVMSCNITNNIQISEELSPEKYVKLINNIFNEIEKIIFRYNGTINRFVGNSVLVYWGYPIQSRKDSENAINAAIEIKEKIEEFNSSIENINFEEYDEQNFNSNSLTQYPINIKIVINSGNALIGQIGSSNVSDFTLLGEAVDITERIESVCAELDKNIIITENTLNQLEKELPTEYLGQVRLKNSNDKIKIFEIKK